MISDLQEMTQNIKDINEETNTLRQTLLSLKQYNNSKEIQKPAQLLKIQYREMVRVIKIRQQLRKLYTLMEKDKQSLTYEKEKIDIQSVYLEKKIEGELSQRELLHEQLLGQYQKKKVLIENLEEKTKIYVEDLPQLLVNVCNEIKPLQNIFNIQSDQNPLQIKLISELPDKIRNFYKLLQSNLPKLNLDIEINKNTTSQFFVKLESSNNNNSKQNNADSAQTKVELSQYQLLLIIKNQKEIDKQSSFLFLLQENYKIEIDIQQHFPIKVIIRFTENLNWIGCFVQELEENKKLGLNLKAEDLFFNHNSLDESILNVVLETNTKSEQNYLNISSYENLLKNQNKNDQIIKIFQPIQQIAISKIIHQYLISDFLKSNKLILSPGVKFIQLKKITSQEFSELEEDKQDDKSVKGKEDGEIMEDENQKIQQNLQNNQQVQVLVQNQNSIIADLNEYFKFQLDFSGKLKLGGLLTIPIEYHHKQNSKFMILEPMIEITSKMLKSNKSSSSSTQTSKKNNLFSTQLIKELESSTNNIQSTTIILLDQFKKLIEDCEKQLQQFEK